MTADFRHRLIELLSSYEGSDAELAKKMGVSKQTISAWRSGTRSPKRPTIESLARYFNVNTAWLMGLDVDRAAAGQENGEALGMLDEDTRTLATGFEKMPQEQKQKLKDFLGEFFSEYFDEFNKKRGNDDDHDA